ncbi:hypothetical protein AB9P05_00845 [Roseivirga sp. BDSF3-8]|uniref:hypothetical protein n=1 Tax=Roseivirga sp. BDSF3-8 TaxID=3241598 RepID=UPI0035327D8F
MKKFENFSRKKLTAREARDVSGQASDWCGTTPQSDAADKHFGGASHYTCGSCFNACYAATPSGKKIQSYRKDGHKLWDGAHVWTDCYCWYEWKNVTPGLI